MRKVMFDICGDKGEVTDEKMLYDKIIKDFDEFFKDNWVELSYFEDDEETKNLRIGAELNSGIYLTHTSIYKKRIFKEKNETVTFKIEHLAVYDKTKLDTVVDVWDELYTSTGLILPAELAWKGISEFIRTGNMSLELEWITTDVIPESGNWC
ncbi:MAG: hypothetical protein K2H23_05050 [Oscillospiraceae bacterium]|nr:hypothetical protein [Oscillospiraceae bacterium]